MKISVIALFTVLITIYGCCPSGSAGNSNNVSILLTTDREFSNLSKEKGMNAAFLQYLDSNGVLLRAGHYPIVGKKAVSYLQDQEDSNFTLTWEPLSGELAASGDLGYTYGLYTFANKDTTFQGTYVSVWKKQKDESWKFVLDTGNPGVGKK